MTQCVCVLVEISCGGDKLLWCPKFLLVRTRVKLRFKVTSLSCRVKLCTDIILHSEAQTSQSSHNEHNRFLSGGWLWECFLVWFLELWAVKRPGTFYVIKKAHSSFIITHMWNVNMCISTLSNEMEIYFTCHIIVFLKF